MLRTNDTTAWLEGGIGCAWVSGGSVHTDALDAFHRAAQHGECIRSSGLDCLTHPAQDAQGNPIRTAEGALA